MKNDKKNKGAILTLPVWRKAVSAIGNIILVLIIVIGLFVAFSLLPINGNFKLFTVMSGSMEPTLPVGSIVFVKPAERYSVGDIVTFSSVGTQDKTTHRIYAISGDGDAKTYTTKGDANSSPDLTPVSEYQIIGKEHFAVPLIGYVLNYIKTPVGLVLIIIIPSVIIVYEEVRKIHREAKEIINRRRQRKNLTANKPKKKVGKNDKNTKA